MQKKTGFVSLIGRPSSGKSTLINTICGYKISIVSGHPQTTRFLVRGIFNDDDSQIIFVDSPGFHHFNSNLNRGLSNLAVRNLSDGDLILYLIDKSREFGEEENNIIEELKNLKDKLIIVFNKIDDEKSKQTKIKDEVLNRLDVKNYIEISAKDNKNIEELVKIIKEKLDFGPLYYPDDYVTDQNIPFRISEVVREKIFNNTNEEIPHSAYVEVDSFEVTEEKIKANATIYLERDTQKGIVIGKAGMMIKKIGQEARIDLAEIFERKVDLFLNVKINLNWRKKDKFIKKMFNLE